jgi:uncharacterized integral membrane protein
MPRLRFYAIVPSCYFSRIGLMRYFNWLWRLCLFFLLIGFTVRNDQPVTLTYFLGFQWESSLIIVLLVFFAAGAAVGVLSMLNIVLKQRRLISSLEREVRVKNKLAGLEDPHALPIQAA